MNPEKLAADLATDLSLDSRSRYELIVAARKLATLDDAQVRAEVEKLMLHHRTAPRLSGALMVLSCGIVEERYASSLSPAAREAYEAAMPEVGTSGDTGSDLDVAEALAHAATAEANGDSGTAATIRAAVAKYQGNA